MPKIQHMVLFDFKEETTPSTIDNIFHELAGLKPFVRESSTLLAVPIRVPRE